LTQTARAKRTKRHFVKAMEEDRAGKGKERMKERGDLYKERRRG